MTARRVIAVRTPARGSPAGATEGLDDFPDILRRPSAPGFETAWTLACVRIYCLRM
jgi:hypothetical protein